MDALEGLGDVGSHRIESLLRTVRKDLDEEVADRGDRFEGIRSEAAFQRVLARIYDERRRGFWARRTFHTQGLLRAVRRVSAVGAALWNSRALRILMP
jgi:hypothetical protein